eukprot:TRINITY_DN4476_c0_g3_i4.p1 TRINITY_DN4476_c0_g3~~TRINITY_DN4476_c0_g3_i4.p1  ORF type:complete len:317 (+),score=138.08 TRINITY_DN4476_c0_g3_i4:57-1007(+)
MAKLVGSYLKEKAVIARTRVTGDELDRAVMKCTSHKVKEPNEKHLKRLVISDYSQEDAAFLVRGIERRLHTHDWVPVVKALVTLHTLLKYSDSQTLQDALHRSQNLYRIAALKLEGAERVSSSVSTFARTYVRYLEERTKCRLTCRLRSRIEQASSVVAEIAAMEPGEGLAVVTALCGQLRLCADLGYSAEWAGNPCSLAGLRLCISDSKLLYVLTSRQVLRLLEGAAALRAADRPAAVLLLDAYVGACSRLQGVFSGAAELHSKGLIDFSVPELRVIEPDRAAKLRQLLSEPPSDDPSADVPEPVSLSVLGLDGV